MEPGGLLDDLNALSHSIIGESAQWALMLGLLVLALVLICAGFSFLMQSMDTEASGKNRR